MDHNISFFDILHVGRVNTLAVRPQDIMVFDDHYRWYSHWKQHLKNSEMLSINRYLQGDIIPLEATCRTRERDNIMNVYEEKV